MSSSNGPKNGEEFEQQIGMLLEQALPHCYLSNVPIFQTDTAMALDTMAKELDFIIHFKRKDAHVLLCIECKSYLIIGDGEGAGGSSRAGAKSGWIAQYPDGPKDIKHQLRGQKKALLTNLEPLDGPVHVHALVVAEHSDGLDPKSAFITIEEPPNFEMSLIPADRLEQCLKKLMAGAEIFRVQQSEILRRIRLGQPVPALGHPEIYNAIEYCRRCRTFIDSEIFQHLDFKHERWAINGSAGMGKSVLLVYATMALITDRCIAMLKDGTRFLQSIEEHAQKIGLAPLEKRHVWVVAHTDKQRQMLEQMFVRFHDLYSTSDPYIEARRVRPQFRVFSEISAIDDCNVLLVDEAHDLGSDWETRVRQWHESKPGNYLIIACDRHQKLRLSNDNARMITGVNFSRSTTKLKRNYRNPFPAYAGCLGLLFRWFTASGPKILPKENELTDAFGFAEVFPETADRLLLRSRNDAHPANNWSHVLSSFPTAGAAYQQLAEFPLRKEQVLWIRFAPEEGGFNYENLQRWSYHSVHSVDAPDLLDKYVKGQEFPVVVIEGVPRMFSWAEVSRVHPDDLARARIEMWQARRLVYLAASRTNVFLYFILSTDMPADVADEFRLMFAQLGHHLEQPSPSGTLWELRVSKQGETETLDDYLDAIEAEMVMETSTPEPVVLSPKLPTGPAKSEVISVEPPKPAAPTASALASPKPEAVQPAPLPPAPQSPPTPVSPVAATSPTAPARPVPVIVPAAAPPQQASTALKSGMVTVFDLSVECRRPLKVVVSILEKNGFKNLVPKQEVNREIAIRILRRTHLASPDTSTTYPSKHATFNSLAEQLNGKLQNQPPVPSTSKQNPPKHD
jgi:hypothetical protein